VSVSATGAGRPDPAARDELARMPDALDRLLGGLDGEGWRARSAPKEWAPGA
jgi:hypothetical protein